MVTLQYTYENSIESFTLPLSEAGEYCQALKKKGVSFQIISTN